MPRESRSNKSDHMGKDGVMNALVVTFWPCVALVVVCALAVGCRPAHDPEAPWDTEELGLIYSMSPPPELPPSPTNAVADNQEAVTLGHRLFFDTRLSQNGQVSCATCHQPEQYFTDGLALGQGVGKLTRHTPTLIGAQWAPFLFWDGRADSLWSQSLGPLEAPKEHGLTRLSLAHMVHTHYRKEYEALFGPMPALADKERFPPEARPIPGNSYEIHSQLWANMTDADKKAINRVVTNIGKALEAYQRKLLPKPAPFDRYVAALKDGALDGGGHLSKQAQRGLRSFVGAGQCINCHNGPLLSDMAFHNLGLPRREGQGAVDLGRTLGAVAVKKDPFRCDEAFSDSPSDPRCQELKYLNPGFEDFRGAFKTPTLRNIAKTGPYMHDGRHGSLDEVLVFYKSLPGEPEVGHRELVLKLLDPDVDSAELIAFLESLTGALPDERWLKPPLISAHNVQNPENNGQHNGRTP